MPICFNSSSDHFLAEESGCPQDGWLLASRFWRHHISWCREGPQLCNCEIALQRSQEPPGGPPASLPHQGQAPGRKGRNRLWLHQCQVRFLHLLGGNLRDASCAANTSIWDSGNLWENIRNFALSCIHFPWHFVTWNAIFFPSEMLSLLVQNRPFVATVISALMSFRIVHSFGKK